MYKLALLACLIFFHSSMQAQTTEEMVSKCRAVTEAKIQGNALEFVQDFDSGVCWGGFGTLQTIGRFVTDEKRILNVGCPPANSTLSQFITIFVAYARKHPERLHEDFVFVAMAALREAFPCQKPTP